MKVIFLDIDGVLNDHSYNKADVCGFKPECIAAMNMVISAEPHLKFIISSAWRYMVSNGAMTLKGFEYLLRVGGLNCKNRIIGITPTDEDYPERGQQIKQTIRTFKPKIDHYLVVDDMPEIIGNGLNLIATDPGIGLTEQCAKSIIDFFFTKR